MNTGSQKQLRLERDGLAEAGRLRWFHWVLIVFIAGATLAAWHATNNLIDERNKDVFKQRASSAVEQFTQRMQKTTVLLWSTAGVFELLGGEISYEQWQSYVQNPDIETQRAGVDSIGVIAYLPRADAGKFVEAQQASHPEYAVYPEHDQPFLMPVVYIDSQSANAKLAGLDIAHEGYKLEAALRARDTGLPQNTAPISLVRDKTSTLGFDLYVPIYCKSLNGSLEERRENFAGLIYASFAVSKLIANSFLGGDHAVGLKLLDGNAVIYDDHSFDSLGYDPAPLYRIKHTAKINGREYTFEIQSTTMFRQNHQSLIPRLILLAGLSIIMLLVALSRLSKRASRHALDWGGHQTNQLQAKINGLQQNNDELERFAYVASHDLRTPIRGVASIADYLEEDLQGYLSSEAANEDVAENLGRLKQQVVRMENLISGILDYSGIGSRSETAEYVNVASLVTALRKEKGLQENQLQLVGDLPVLVTYRVRFQQVIDNLVGNAFKYHHDPANAIVRIECQEGRRFFKFSVSDNGPGIDERFHERIFEVFQSLQSKDEVEGSGVGLSIVKKSVEELGGQIEVKSKLGAGSTFIFEWPISVNAHERLKKQ